MIQEQQITEREILKKSRDYNLYTWVPQKYADNYIAVKSGKGCYYWDYSGKKYLDAASQLVNVNIGLQHPKVVEAIKAQADQLCYINPIHATKTRALLSERLLTEAAPGMGKVLYTLTGSDCNEHAIRIAQDYTGKYKMLTQYISYHGFPYGGASLTGQCAPRGVIGPEIAGFVHFMGPWWRDHGLQFESEEDYSAFLLRMLERQIIQEGPDKIAAVMTESMLGCSGAVPMPKGYLRGLRALCDKYNILLICDETVTGFGRTGKWFTYQYYDILPDLITFSKGITSGYEPMGGVIVSREIAEFYEEHPLPLDTTYNAHPLCTAAALATLDVYKEENLFENAVTMGERLLDGLKKLCETHSCIENPRGLGLMTAVDLAKPLVEHGAFTRLSKMFMDKGVVPYTLPRHILVTPPLIVTADEIDQILTAMDEVLTKAENIRWGGE